MWLFNKSHLPFANGPYIPGCTDIMIGYTEKGLFFRLYYPTNKNSHITNYTSDWIRWLPDNSYLRGFSKVVMVWVTLIRIIMWFVSGKIYVPVVYGAKIRTDQKLKCIVFSHGLGATRFLYSSLCTELASHGFLVATIEHRDHSSCSTYYYKSTEDAVRDIRTFINFKPIRFGNNHYTLRNEQLQQRANECVQLIDLLIDLNSGSVPVNILDNRMQNEFKLNDLTNLIDVDNITMMGHSFGAATSLLTMSCKKELKQGVILDAWMFPLKEMPDVITDLKQSLLFINTQTFHIPSNVKIMERFLDVNEENRFVYTLLHTTHESQTDTAFVFGYWLNWFMKKLSPANAIKINNALILTYLNKQLNHPGKVNDYERYLLQEAHNVVSGISELKVLINY